MQPVWPKLVALNINTVLAPVYWELIEPAEGKMDVWREGAPQIDFLSPEFCRGSVFAYTDCIGSRTVRMRLMLARSAENAIHLSEARK
jgi:hypothetical protein